MSDTMEIYSELVKKRTSYSANPFTLTNITVGDILMEEDGILTSAGTNIKDKFGYEIKTIQYPYHGNMEFSTQGVKSIVNKTLGEAYEVKLDINVDFSKDSQVFFHIEDAHVIAIVDKIALGQKMLKWYKDEKFKKHWRVVTEVVYAAMTAIAISQEEKSSYSIGFKLVPIKDIIPSPINLPVDFDFQSNVGIVNKNSLSYEMSQKNSSPLLHMLQIHQWLFFKPHPEEKLLAESKNIAEQEKIKSIFTKLQEKEIQPKPGKVITQTQEITTSDLGETIEILEANEI
ncbi:MAG: hypothetical protein ACM3S2_04600 [Ignavibacteriales bacterium]